LRCVILRKRISLISSPPVPRNAISAELKFGQRQPERSPSANACLIILLNLVLSRSVPLQDPIIVMSQRREKSKDRLRGENDYYEVSQSETHRPPRLAPAQPPMSAP
jgi:hypothetical protein